MTELRLPWHAGRTTGRALYDGDGPDDLIGVMDTRELAAVVVAAVNAQDARWRALVGEHAARLESEVRSLQSIRTMLVAWPAYLHAPGIAGALTSLDGVQKRLVQAQAALDGAPPPTRGAGVE